MPVYRGQAANGVVVLDDGIALPEGSTVKVEPEKAPSTRQDALYHLHDFAGPTGVPDLAKNIDHYLYGHPRMTDNDE